MYFFRRGAKHADAKLLQLKKVCEDVGLPHVCQEWLKEAVAAGGGRLLGRGAYGEVRLAKDPDGRLLVVKTFYGSISDLLAEAVALWMARPVAGVQCLVGVCPEALQIVSVYAGRTTLCRALKERSLKSTDILIILMQVLTAIDGLHKQGLCHNDIKGDNVCLARKKGGIVLATVIDLGLARRSGSVPYDFNLRRPNRLYWLPPELKKKGRCCSATDVYSVASLVQRATESMDSPPRKLLWWAQRALTIEPSVRPSLAEGLAVLESLINPSPHNTLRCSFHKEIRISRGCQRQPRSLSLESYSQASQQISSCLSTLAQMSNLRPRNHPFRHSF